MAEYVYVFVRQDIPLPQQSVQSLHAVYSLTTLSNLPPTVPNIVFVGVPNLAALKRVETKMKACGIPHYAWHEPDGDLGFTSLATVPLVGSQREMLLNYRVWSFPHSSICRASASKADDAGANPAEGANAEVAQLREQSAFS